MTATNTEVGRATRTLSQANGSYLVQVPAGFYRVSAEISGFKHTTSQVIQVNLDQAVVVNLALELGVVSENVAVEGQTSLVNTVSGAVGYVVQNKQITDLPLNGRAVFDLANLTPASFNLSGGDQRTELSIAGGRTNSAMAFLDGVINLRGGIGSTTVDVSPPIEATQEFKILSNNYAAEYGRSAAGIVLAVTKSGTNSFHGNLYEFLRNDSLDSTGWGVDRKARLRRNQLGSSLGGPIARNRTFFFFNFEGIRERRGRGVSRRVPTLLERAGDFSGTQFSDRGVGRLLPIYDPLTNQPFPNNAIPASRQDAVAKNVLAFIPLPNRVADNPITLAGNWQENIVDPITRDKHTMRVDHSFADSKRISWRYTLAAPDNVGSGGTTSFGPADPNFLTDNRRFQNMGVNYQHIFSPSLVATLLAGYARTLIVRKGAGLGQDIPEKIGLKGVPEDVFPRFVFSGGLVPMTAIGASGEPNRRAGFTNGQLEGSLTLVKANHNFKFGSQYFQFQGNDVNRIIPSGLWTFEPIQTQGRGVVNSGLPLADFFLGQPSSVQFGLGSGVGKRSFYIAGYFQDDWKVHPRLTLNIGIRYEIESPLSEVYNRLNSFDPSVPHPLAGRFGIPEGTLGVFTFAGRNGKGSRLENWDKNNFSPRFGFAWRATGSELFVMRGGFGIFYGNPFDGNLVKVGHTAFDSSRTFVNPVPFKLDGGVPPGFLVTPPLDALKPEFGALGTQFPQSLVEYIDPTRRTQYTESFNLSVERQFRSTVFEIGYLGNMSRKVIFRNININQMRPEMLARTDIPERLRRPFPQFPGDRAVLDQQVPHWGISNYHALFFRSERRFSSGVGWIATYTWSKKIDNLIEAGGTLGGANDQIQNLYNLKDERSASNNDIRQRLVLSPIVELPFGPGKRWASHGVLSYLTRGWSLGMIAIMQSGSPFGVTVANGPAILGDRGTGRLLRPNLVKDPDLPSSRKGQPATGGVRGIQWIDPDAFTVPAAFTFGNASRTLPGIAGPGLVNFDVSVMKNIAIRESTNLQFRFEMFNAMNTPHFRIPQRVLGAGSVGIADATGSDRELQFALKLSF